MKRENSIALKRTALAVVLATTLGQGTAWAQSTSGDIVGTVSASMGEKVQIKSLNSGVTRELAITDGRFRFPSLPAGQYEVTINHDGSVVGTRVVTVVAGQAATANFSEASRLDTIVVRGTGPNAIDLSSIESRTTFTASSSMNCRYRATSPPCPC
jgi:hypothetical protein